MQPKDNSSPVNVTVKSFYLPEEAILDHKEPQNTIFSSENSTENDKIEEIDSDLDLELNETEKEFLDQPVSDK